MKILTPFPLTSDQVASNAPVEQFAEWEPEGRDTLSNIPSPVMAANGDTLYYITGNGDLDEQHDIGVQDLETGEVLAPFGSVAGIGKAMAVSPNGSWLALIREEDSGYYLNVFDLQTDQLVYTDSVFGSNSRPLVAWSSASDYLAYTDSTFSVNDLALCASIVSSATWGSPERTVTVSTLAGHSNTQAHAIDGLDWDDSGSLFFTCLSIVDVFSGPYSCRLAKFSSSADTLENIELSGQPFNYKMGVNRDRGEVLVLGTSTQQLYAASDLAALSTPSSLQFKANEFRRSPGGTEFFLRSAGTSPPNKRFNSADYAALPAFPDVGSSQLMVYTEDYALFPFSGGGYDIVDRSNNEQIELINPQVSEGDTYIYEERVYEALVDNQSRPDTGAVLEVPEWVDLGPINPLRMFDGSINSVTTANSDLVIQVNVDEVVRAVALFNVSATTVRIQMQDQGGAEVYDSGELDLVGNEDIQDLNAYFFDGITLSPDFVFTALPPYLNATVIVTLTALGDVASVGEMVVGSTHELGDTEYGTGVGILDFSRKERDEFGNFKVVERRFSKRANYEVSIPTRLVSSVQQRLAKYRSVPVVFIGAEARPETVVYGFYRSFDIVLEGPKFSNCSIDVEGLT